MSTEPNAGCWRSRMPEMISAIPGAGWRTLGGRHFWSDLQVTQTHRIQRQIWTGHCRLLDRSDRRLASGSLSHCRAESHRRFPEATPARSLVVLLHGLYRSRHSLRRLERALNDAGLNTLAPNYPSGHTGLVDLGQWLNALMDEIQDCDRLAFVTHSLGGLVLRSALAQEAGWRSRIPIAGIVQIGPPNRGAQMANALRYLPQGERIAGPAARGLRGPLDLAEPPSEIPLLVIAGGTQRRWGFNPWLRGDNDGVVRVDETRLERDHDLQMVSTIHGLLLGHPQTARSVRAALTSWGIAG